MPSLVLIGAQWGDEGKGKLVDYLTSNADSVVRFQGGNNAGHTLVVNGKKTSLHLVPSGILRDHTTCYVGAGVVLDPDVFLGELEGLKEAGIDISEDRLVLDRNLHLVLEYHRALDQEREAAKGDKKIGTTGRGIGPCYEDRANRSGVRLAELEEPEELRTKLEHNIEQRNKYLKGVLGSERQVEFDQVWEQIERAREKILPYMGNVSRLLDQAFTRGDRVLFEGAQGTLLDQTFGTFPFVTSSHTVAGAVTIGSGIGPKHVDHVLGVAKAYCTRVGSGPFPTELDDSVGELMREKGGEFGTTTGRPRRCGWFDSVAMKTSVRLNGIDSLAITKLDVLSGFEKIKICIRYNLDGKEIKDMPAVASQLDRVEPVYIELDGWEGDLGEARKWHQLPAEARLYLSTISEIIGCPVTIASVGAERESTIFSSGASFVKNFASVREG